LKLIQKIKEGSDFFFHNQRWERREVPRNFCKYCDHHKKEHGDKVCFECRKLKESSDFNLISNHKFNEEPIQIVKELAKILHNATFQDDHYYMGISMESVDIDILKEVEKVFNWKLCSISARNLKGYLWITFYKTTIFCRYCGSPKLTMQDKMKHEQAGGLWSCHKKPEEVTFVTS